MLFGGLFGAVLKGLPAQLGSLLEARGDIFLQLPQRRRLQRLEVDLDLVGVGLPERGFSRLDDVDDLADLVAGQLVDVEGQLSLLVVGHGLGVIVLIRVVIERIGWLKKFKSGL